MVEVQTPITDVCNTGSVHLVFQHAQSDSKWPADLLRIDSIFAKDSSATSGLLKKIQIVPSTVVFEPVNTFPLHFDIFRY